MVVNSKNILQQDLTKSFCWCILTVVREMFLKRAFEMTDMIDKFNVGIEALQGPKAHVYRKGAEAVNLAAIFKERGITFGASDINEK